MNIKSKGFILFVLGVLLLTHAVFRIVNKGELHYYAFREFILGSGIVICILIDLLKK